MLPAKSSKQEQLDLRSTIAEMLARSAWEL
jgi:hypothetical protein